MVILTPRGCAPGSYPSDWSALYIPENSAYLSIWGGGELGVMWSYQLCSWSDVNYSWQLLSYQKSEQALWSDSLMVFCYFYHFVWSSWLCPRPLPMEGFEGLTCLPHEFKAIALFMELFLFPHSRFSADRWLTTDRVDGLWWIGWDRLYNKYFAAVINHAQFIFPTTGHA